MTDQPAHSELGASVAARFFACPGSVLLGRGIPPRGSIYAERGTAAHALGELCLLSGRDTDDYVGQTIEGLLIDDETANNVQVYVDTCRETLSSADEFGVEQRFSLEAFNPPVAMFGTADFWSRTGTTLRVCDYKNGWLDVKAEGNPQLKYYALGAMLLVDRPIHKVEAIIIQRDQVKRTEFDPVELMEWSVTLIDKAIETQKPGAPLAAGPWCRFCPVSGRCPEQARAALAVAGVEFDAPAPPPDPSTLSPAEVGRLLSLLPGLRMWSDALQTAGIFAISRGEDVPGWKLVPTRPQAGWVDDDEARTVLTRDYQIDPHAPPELLSPAKVRAVLAHRAVVDAKQHGHKLTKKDAEVRVKAALSSLVTYRSSGLSLVSVADTRDGAPTAGSEFQTPEGSIPNG